MTIKHMKVSGSVEFYMFYMGKSEVTCPLSLENSLK